MINTAQSYANQLKNLSLAYISAAPGHQWQGPVTSLHFWVINTHQRGVPPVPAPVTSLHFWVINTRWQGAHGIGLPVTSLHFWVINTLWRVITWE